MQLLLKEQRKVIDEFKSTKNNEQGWYKKITDGTPVIIRHTESGTKCTFINKKWHEYTGKHVEEALNYGWLNSIHPKDREYVEKQVNQANSKQIFFHIEYRLKRWDDTYRWHTDSGQPQFDDLGIFTGHVGAIVDIHDRKLAEEKIRESENYYKKRRSLKEKRKKIRESEERYKTALKYSPVVFAKCDTQLRYEWILNPHSDFQSDAVIGKRDDELGDNPGITAMVKLKQHVIDTRQQTREEITFDLSGGSRTYDVTFTPLINNSHIAGVITASLDITERKEVEKALQKAYEQLSNSNQDLTNKNEQLSKVSQLHQNLLYIIAHDLRSPISNMYLVFDLLEEEQDPEKIVKLKNSLKQMVARQETILDSLGQIIKAQSLEDIKYQTVNLEKVAKDILKSNELGLKEVGGRVDYNFDEVKTINHVHSFVYSILRNLVTNAIKYHQEGRSLQVKITSSRKSDHMLITVADNGMGMDLEAQGKNLFKPFKRLTTKAKGTGIGLYIIKSLIEKNGGYIEVSSTPGKGTTFYCYFKEY